MQIALQAQACDTLVTAQAKLINDQLKYEASQDSLLIIRGRTTSILTLENAAVSKQYENQKALTKIQANKKKKWMGVTALIVLAEILVRFFAP